MVATVDAPGSRLPNGDVAVGLDIWHVRGFDWRTAGQVTTGKFMLQFYGASLAAAEMLPAVGEDLIVTGIEAGPEISNGVTSVFWSGGNVASDAANEWAVANGGQTLEMTSSGQWAEGITQDMPWDQARSIWESVSRTYAQNAEGEVHVFLNSSGINPQSIWLQTELPTLGLNDAVTNIIYHFVP